MTDSAEYLQFAAKKECFSDFPLLLELLRKNQPSAYTGNEAKLARTMRFDVSDDGGLLFFEVFVGAFALLTFQQTAKKRPFFLNVVRSIWKFLSLFTIDVRLVFFFDTTSRTQALEQETRQQIGYLDRAHSPSGVAVYLTDQPRFYFCLYSAALNAIANTEPTDSTINQYYANATVLALSEEEAQNLLVQFLAENGARLLSLEELDQVAPLETVPELEISAFRWEPHRIVYSSGRAFFSEDQAELSQ